MLYGLTGIAGCQTLFFIAASRLPVGVALMLEFSGPVLVVAWLKFGQKVAVPRSAALGVRSRSSVSRPWPRSGPGCRST